MSINVSTPGSSTPSIITPPTSTHTQPPRQRYAGYATPAEAPLKVERERMLKLLNPEQQHCYSLILEGNNTFLTGYPGVGKTYLLSSILEACHVQAPIDQVAITGMHWSFYDSRSRWYRRTATGRNNFPLMDGHRY
jgi:superfamily I DNA and RNA helicase